MTRYRNARLADQRLVSITVADGVFERIADTSEPLKRAMWTWRSLVLPSLIDCHVHLDKTF